MGHACYGYAINNVGQVVGTSYDLRGAFLNSGGQTYSLNSLIDPALRINLFTALSINDSGQIVANGSGPLGTGRAFLLTPIPEPSTLALFGVALLALAAWIGPPSEPPRSRWRTTPETKAMTVMPKSTAHAQHQAHSTLPKRQALPSGTPPVAEDEDSSDDQGVGYALILGIAVA